MFSNAVNVGLFMVVSWLCGVLAFAINNIKATVGGVSSIFITGYVVSYYHTIVLSYYNTILARVTLSLTDKNTCGDFFGAA